MYRNGNTNGTVYVSNPFFDPEVDDPDREELALYGEGDYEETGNGIDEPYDCQVEADYFELDDHPVERSLLTEVFSENWSRIESDLEGVMLENRGG